MEQVWNNGNIHFKHLSNRLQCFMANKFSMLQWKMLKFDALTIFFTDLGLNNRQIFYMIKNRSNDEILEWGKNWSKSKLMEQMPSKWNIHFKHLSNRLQCFMANKFSMLQWKMLKFDALTIFFTDLGLNNRQIFYMIKNRSNDEILEWGKNWSKSKLMEQMPSKWNIHFKHLSNRLKCFMANKFSIRRLKFNSLTIFFPDLGLNNRQIFWMILNRS